MRDTLRRKSGKSVDLDASANDLSHTTSNSASTTDSSLRHQRSVSNASVLAGGTGEKNPWIDSSRSPRDPVGDSPDARGRTQNLDVPGSGRSDRSVSEKPTRRRKKTLNQVTPHRFELVDAKRDSIKPPVPTDSRSPTPPDDVDDSQTRQPVPSDDVIVSKTRQPVERRSVEPPTPLSTPLQFSSIKPIGNVPQIKPRPQRNAFSRICVSANITPIAPPSPPTPPDSISTSPKRQSHGLGVDFLGMDFGGSRAEPSNHFMTSPTSMTSQRREPSFLPSDNSSSNHEPYTFRPPHDPLPSGSLFNKVVIVTNGTSTISAPLIRCLHRAGARVIFSAPHNLADKARNFIRELGPPDTVHFNGCDLGHYSDIHALFKLGMTMYGRIDHAVFAPGDDGGQVRGIGAGEQLWGLDVGLAQGRAMTSKAELELADRGEAVDADQVDMGDMIGASTRFARIAMAFLRNSPGRRQVHAGGNSSGGMLTPKSGTTTGGFSEAEWSDDRSLTFISSTAAFTPVPFLPVYSSAQHATLGVARSLGDSVDVRRDGVRVNLVATNMLLPSVVEAAGGGRMSVRLPGERGDDVSNIVAGVIAEGLASSSSGRRGEVPTLMHGRLLYAVGEEAVDVQDGLQASERSWLGSKAKEALDRASGKAEGLGKGRWMLMDTGGMDSPF